MNTAIKNFIVVNTSVETFLFKFRKHLEVIYRCKGGEMMKLLFLSCIQMKVYYNYLKQN